MIAKLHKKGRSHVGLGRYLLHDKERASTSERVAWAEVRNLATRNPHTACRVMAATALDAPRLKSEAGIKNTGRKSADSVLHLTLSYHPSESKDLTKEEMVRAANGAIRALGAEDRQALIVCHNDEDHVHVHVALCRTSPVDGRMLSSSKEKLNLSRWAERYERDRGRIFCDNRVVNNAARDRGEYTRGQADKPRHIYELEAANAHKPEAERIRIEQKRLDLALVRRSQAMRVRHARELEKLASDHRDARRAILDGRRAGALAARDHVRAAFRPRWEERHHEHQAALRDFERREDRLLGGVRNALRVIDFKAVLSGGSRGKAFREAYNALSSAGARFEAFKRAQALRDRALWLEQRRAEAVAAGHVRMQTGRSLADRRAVFRAERAAALVRHDLERAADRAAWKTRSRQRRAAFERTCDASEERRPSGKQSIGQHSGFSEQTKALADELRRVREARNRDRHRRR